MDWETRTYPCRVRCVSDKYWEGYLNEGCIYIATGFVKPSDMFESVYIKDDPFERPFAVHRFEYIGPIEGTAEKGDVSEIAARMAHYANDPLAGVFA